jgi:aminopeptidase
MVDGRLEAYARLIVRVGLNLEAGQDVAITAHVEHAPLVRALARASYEAGAHYVDVLYQDFYVKKAMIELASDEALEYTPSYMVERLKDLEARRGARIAISGDDPSILGELDQHRVGRARMTDYWEVNLRQVTERLVSWVVVGYPTPSWAEAVFGEPDVERLWDAVAAAVRLDEPDPVEAWRRHVQRLAVRAELMNERSFDALHFRGGGTDLTVGLLPSSRWIGGGEETVDGVPHMANLPTEEVFTSPDPQRVEGVVRATKPLFTQGRIIEGLSVRFEGGRAVQIEAASEADADVMRTLVAQDDGGTRLGELALVDREGRIGPLDTVFYDTLLDENAASHMALGSAYESAVGDEDHDRLNKSAIHIDFMIGSADVDVTGITRDGERVPVLREAAWQL